MFLAALKSVQISWILCEIGICLILHSSTLLSNPAKGCHGEQINVGVSRKAKIDKLVHTLPPHPPDKSDFGRLLAGAENRGNGSLKSGVILHNLTLTVRT